MVLKLIALTEQDVLVLPTAVKGHTRAGSESHGVLPARVALTGYRKYTFVDCWQPEKWS